MNENANMKSIQPAPKVLAPAGGLMVKNRVLL